jgi:hypothetical protein
MKRSRYTEEQIIGILREHEAGAKPAELCRKHWMSEATFSMDCSPGGLSGILCARPVAAVARGHQHSRHRSRDTVRTVRTIVETHKNTERTTNQPDQEAGIRPAPRRRLSSANEGARPAPEESCRAPRAGRESAQSRGIGSGDRPHVCGNRGDEGIARASVRRPTAPPDEERAFGRGGPLWLRERSETLHPLI